MTIGADHLIIGKFPPKKIINPEKSRPKNHQQKITPPQ
jgi:hypothetical protein